MVWEIMPDAIVIDCEHGYEALNRLEKKQGHYAKQPDLIILDWIMPVMGGRDFLAALIERDSWRESRVIVVTNSNSIEDRKEALSLGASAYLQKPMIKANLLEILLKLWPMEVAQM